MCHRYFLVGFFDQKMLAFKALQGEGLIALSKFLNTTFVTLYFLIQNNHSIHILI